MRILIRAATLDDNEALTNISFSAKRYWKYPEEYFAIWNEELTITPEYIHNNQVIVAEKNGQAIGYCSLVEVKRDFWAGQVFVNKGYWLEHIFIQPEYLGQGIGMQLINHLKAICRELGIATVYIFSDPNARGFYDKIGAGYIKESPSSIEGRTVSLYEMNMEGGI